MLTRKQKELLLLIRDRLASDGVPPSFDEMKEALGLKSKSGIHRLITGLEERGFIKRLPHRARALEIVRLPDGADAKPATTKQALRNFKTRSDAHRGPSMPDMAAIAAAQSVALPLYGRIAAGTPIEALRDPNGSLDVPAGLLASSRGKGDAASHYALEISGDSMIEAGIFDGDRVIIQSCDTADNGAIVVALVDGQEATLKYLKREGGLIALEPANRHYETRRLPAARVKVQGKLVGLMRRY
ncbi:MAG: transcriptional repressor LexA [Alphaproteobacteria bacterium]|nr:transcriptional repressor LexA [Alphaproteobacteria bacterium]